MVRSRSLSSAFAVLVSVLALSFVHPGSAEAQATIQVSSSASTITKIGQTELVGLTSFTVVSGTTVAGTIEFFVPNVAFTNDATTGITLQGTGGLATATISAVIPSNGIVIINIPAGAGAGSSVTLAGVRVSAVGATFSTLDAAVSSSGNAVVAGQNSVRIVRGIADGMVVSNTGDGTLTVTNGVVVTGPGTITVQEGWANSFSSAVGVLGQTGKTQVIFQVMGLPDNVTVTFPTPLFSGSGAALTTLSGVPETLSNQSTTNRVVYEFTDSGSSPSVIDAFDISPALGFTDVPGTGTASIQVALGPIGAAVPSTDFPSTAIPRFAALFLPPPVAPPPPVTRTITTPVLGFIDDQTLAISNTGSGAAIITATALRDDGSLASVQGLTNQVTLNAAAHQTLSVSLKDIFGTAASPSNIASVQLQSQNTALVLNSIATTGGRRFGVNVIPELAQTYLPFDRQTSADIPVLTLHNAGAASVTVTINLRNSLGATLSTASRTVNSLGADRESFATLFPSISLPLDGYVVITSSAPIRTALVNNPATRPDEVPTLDFLSSPMLFPYFVFGGGYNSVMTLINQSDTQTIQVSLNAYTGSGATLSSQPYVRTMAPREKQNFDFAGIFGAGSAGQVAIGYFSVTLGTTVTSPFSTPPQVLGSLRVSTNTLSSVAPLVADAGAKYFLTPTAENSTTYTGLAVANPNSGTTSVTVDSFSSAGAALGSVTFTLNGGTARIQLLRELVPQSLIHDGGLVRITSAPGNVKVLSFRGTLNSSELIYLRPTPAP